VRFKAGNLGSRAEKVNSLRASACFCSVDRAVSQGKDVPVLLIDFQGFGDNSDILSPEHNVIQRLRLTELNANLLPTG
jgi:hypothetical protein